MNIDDDVREAHVFPDTAEEPMAKQDQWANDFENAAAEALRIIGTVEKSGLDISIHYVPLDPLDNSWDFTVIGKEDGTKFMIARKMFGVVKITAFIGV